MRRNLDQLADQLKAEIEKMTEGIMVKLIEQNINSHSGNPQKAISAIRNTFTEDSRFQLKEIDYLPDDNQILVYALVKKIGWAKHYAFSTEGKIVQIGRKITDQEIPTPSWLDGFGDFEVKAFRNIWRELAESEFLPAENIKIGIKYGLLETYKPYYLHTMRHSDSSESFRAILTAFLNESTKLIEMEKIFGSPQAGENILDLGT